MDGLPILLVDFSETTSQDKNISMNLRRLTHRIEDLKLEVQVVVDVIRLCHKAFVLVVGSFQHHNGMTTFSIGNGLPTLFFTSGSRLSINTYPFKVALYGYPRKDLLTHNKGFRSPGFIREV